MKNETTKNSKDNLDMFTLGCLGVTLSIPVFFLSGYILYSTYYFEDSQSDPEGDYIMSDFTPESKLFRTWYEEKFAGTWVIENPYFFVRELKAVEELENWRKTKLVISEDGTFELIQPPFLLAKRLLIESSAASPALSVEQTELIRQATITSIIGQWTKETDDKGRISFHFHTNENAVPQHVQIVKVNNDYIKNVFKNEVRLHWKTDNHIYYPKEGVIWRKFEEM